MLDKKRLRREIEKERRKKVKGRLLELKAQIKDARAKRDEAIRAVQIDCRLKREELRQSCGLRRTRAKASGAAEVLERQSELKGEKRFERQIRSGDRPRNLRRTTAERRQESDDEVRSNIAADMVPVFNSVRKHIKGSPRKSRTEAFLQWAEENPGEVFDLMQHDADRYLAGLLAEQERLNRESKRRSLAAVPF
jgi:hypothetical protein